MFLLPHQPPDSLLRKESSGQSFPLGNNTVPKNLWTKAEETTKPIKPKKTGNWGQKPEPQTHAHTHTHRQGSRLMAKNYRWKTPRKQTSRLREREVAKIVFVSGCIHWVVMMDVVGRDMLRSSFGCLHPTLKTITHTREPQYIYTFASLSLSCIEQRSKQTIVSWVRVGIWNAL